ncbi:MAG: helix-turn-helix transcriptional regulator [Desulfobacteraceae bacterium]|jgi:transcriptional regulator with XRE-family HTH domain
MKWYEILKSSRIDSGLSLRAVEAKTGISNAYISQIENGLVKEPSFFKMLRLLPLYGIRPEALGNKAQEPATASGLPTRVGLEGRKFMIKINDREFPLWSQFVEEKEKFIGGILEDHDNGPFCAPGIWKTEITDIELIPNGESSAFFRVCGKDFSCGFDVSVGGIDGSFSENGWIGFSGYGGHQWRIKGINNKEIQQIENNG